MLQKDQGGIVYYVVSLEAVDVNTVICVIECNGEPAQCSLFSARYGARSKLVLVQDGSERSCVICFRVEYPSHDTRTIDSACTSSFKMLLQAHDNWWPGQGKQLTWQRFKNSYDYGTTNHTAVCVKAEAKDITGDGVLTLQLWRVRPEAQGNSGGATHQAHPFITCLHTCIKLSQLLPKPNKPNGTKRNKTKRNGTKRNETKRNKTKQNKRQKQVVINFTSSCFSFQNIKNASLFRQLLFYKP